MNRPVEPISRSQFFLLVMVSIVAGGVYLWPEYLVQKAGGDALWSLLTTLLVAIGLTLLQVLWAVMVDRSTYFEALQATWGPVCLWFMVPITVILTLGGVSILVALFVNMLSTFFYPETPAVVLAGIIMGAGFVIAIRPLATVARIVQFWFPLVLLSVLVIVVLSLGNIRFYTPLLPSSELAIPAWARASLGTWFLYANGGLVTSLVPHVRWRGKPRPALWAMLAIALQGAILLLLYGLIMTTLGPTAVSRLTWPIIYLFGLVMLRTSFIQGIGMFVMINWTIAIVLYIGVNAFWVGWNVESVTGATDSGRRWMVSVISLLVLVAALQFPSDIAEKDALFRFYNPISFVWTAGLGIASWCVAWVRKTIGWPARRREPRSPSASTDRLE